MMNIRFYRIFISIIWFASCNSAYTQTTPPDDPSQMTIRLRPISPDDSSRKMLWQKLLEISKPVQLEIAADEPIQHAISRQCGSASRDLIEFITELNPDGGSAVEDTPRVWRSFPCPYWDFDSPSKPVKIPVSKDQSLSDVLPFHMGDNGPKSVAAVKRLNPGVISGSGKVKADVELRLPYRIKSKTIELTNELVDKPGEAVETVVQAVPQLAADQVFQKTAATATKTYKLVAEDFPASDGNTTCAGPEGASSWPIDMKAGLALLQQDKEAQKYPGPETVILVADTGFDPAVEETGMLWVNKPVKDTQDSDSQRSVTDYSNDLHGANLVDSNGDISPTMGYPLYLHGTEVFDVLVGGVKDTAGLSRYLAVAGAKIVTSTLPFRIDRSALHESFRYATQIKRQNPSVVLNLSAVSSGQIGGLADALKATDILVVAAAGNNHDRVDSLDIYPPAFSDYRERLIVVGAHDWDNNVADFSNRGMLVDLLAPGCKLPIKDPDGKIRSVSGTSFATPIVSLTAGMLSSMGLKPWEVKNRILASVDFDDRLINVVATSGRLNMLNALRVHTDILELRDPATNQISTFFGKVDRSKTWVCRRGSSSSVFRPTEIARLIGNYPAQGGKSIRVLTNPRSPGNLLAQAPCDSLSGSLIFEEDGKGPLLQADWSNVVNIIFRAM